MNNKEITRGYITLQFSHSLRVSSISQDDFNLLRVLGDLDSTENVVEDPFKPIDISNHYNSIRRTLTLYFNEYLEPFASYKVVAYGLLDSVGRKLSALEVEFDYEFEVPGEDGVYDPYERPRLEIEDHSIQKTAFNPADSINVANPNFFITRSSPENGSIFIEDDTDGRVVIAFSQRPDEEFINESFIKVQKKKVTHAFNRWEVVDADISLDSEENKLYIDIPITEESEEHFQTGYKYRIRISADIEADGKMLGSDQELVFITELSPVYVDPEEIANYFAEASLVEILELIHGFSVEVSKLFKNRELSPVAYDYIRAATLCALARTYDDALGGQETSFTLGQLQVTDRRYSQGAITRANASNWCELAAALRLEMYRIGGKGVKGVVKGSKLPNPMPDRAFKDLYETWGHRRP